MAKRSDGQFERRANDFYSTWDPRACKPLLRHLEPGTRFVEPCAGDGTLVDTLEAAGHVCARAWDLEPQRDDIEACDALDMLVGNIDCFITNPPWSRPLLHDLIVHLSDQAPTWLLFDSDWAFTKALAPPLLVRCAKIVAVGRLKWIKGSKHDSKDNCAWYLFKRPEQVTHTEFVGR